MNANVLWRGPRIGALALLLLGCGAQAQHSAAEAKHQSWLNATVEGPGRCGVPVVRFEDRHQPHGVNAVGLPTSLPVGAQIQLRLGALEPSDPRTMVDCHTFGVIRGWVLIEEARLR